MKKNKIKIKKCGCKYELWSDILIWACTPCEYHLQKQVQENIKNNL